MSIKVLDTFAGAGGFSLGFELAGANIVGAIETDQWACDTFQHNHPNSLVLKSDITLLTEKEILKSFSDRKPDIVLGGPPCQGFSICNKNNGDTKDPRNSLFKDFIRVGKILTPEILIMENVPNLIKAKTQNKMPVIDIITDELEKLGYHVYKEILEATNYGIPQIRKRLFVIASKKELTTPFPISTHQFSSNIEMELFRSNLSQCPTLWEAISDLPELEAREGAEEMDYTTRSQNPYQKLLRKDSKKLFNHSAMKHSQRMVERFSIMSWGESTADVPEYLKPYKRNGHGEISKKIYDQNNRRMHPHRPCHTIAASFYANFVHPFKHRNFTAREGARIQSFPDWYVFKGKPTVVSHKLLAREGRTDEKYLCQYNQIGNAVPPLLSKAIAENILKQI